jgi:MFS family permease
MSHDAPAPGRGPAPTGPTPGRGRTFRALRHRNFRLFWSGQIISQVGTSMQFMAQSWLVYDLTDSPFMLGLVSFAALLPVLPVSLLSGVISDRFPRRPLIILTESVLMLQALTMAALTWSGVLQVWHVIALSFVYGAAAALEQPARLAFVVDTVGKEDLTSAVGLNAAVYNTARIVGPSLAGLLVAWIGEAGCFLLNGLSFLPVIAALLAIRLPPRPAARQRLRVVGSLMDGFRYVWTTQAIRGVLVIVAVAGLLTMPYVSLMPVFAKDILQGDSRSYGFLMAGVGAGAILGALSAATIGTGRRGRWLSWGNVLGPLFVLSFCLSKSFPLSLALVILAGVANAVRQTLCNSLIQINTQEQYHGRVMSIFNLLFTGMSQAGTLLMGGLAEGIGAPVAVGAGALASVALGLLFVWRLPHVRRLP